jgi:type 1 fimbria pilin
MTSAGPLHVPPTMCRFTATGSKVVVALRTISTENVGVGQDSSASQHFSTVEES